MADENYYQHDGLDYPFIEGLPRAIDDLNSPYPSSFFVQTDDYPYVMNVPDGLDFSNPLPIGFYSQNNNEYPIISDVPDEIIAGAFCHAVNLSSVIIPESVKTIGRYSFSYTALTAVTLPEDCTYYSTSFPKDCAITGGVIIA